MNALLVHASNVTCDFYKDFPECNNPLMEILHSLMGPFPDFPNVLSEHAEITLQPCPPLDLLRVDRSKTATCCVWGFKVQDAVHSCSWTASVAPVSADPVGEDSLQVPGSLGHSAAASAWTQTTSLI